MVDVDYAHCSPKVTNEKSENTASIKYLDVTRFSELNSIQ